MSAMKCNLPNAARGRQQMVTFKVGPGGAIYYIHMHIICRESRFFKTALNSQFKEGQTKEMVLEETDEEVFKLIMHWTYTRELPGPNSEQKWKEEMVKDDDGEEVELTWDFLLSSAYVFAKMYDIPLLASTIHRLFRERFLFWQSKCPSTTTICRIFENVHEDSWLCVLFVEQYVKYWDPKTASEKEKERFQYLPNGFLQRSINSFARARDARCKPAPVEDFDDFESFHGDEEPSQWDCRSDDVYYNVGWFQNQRLFNSSAIQDSDDSEGGYE